MNPFYGAVVVLGLIFVLLIAWLAYRLRGSDSEAAVMNLAAADLEAEYKDED